MSAGFGVFLFVAWILSTGLLWGFAEAIGEVLRRRRMRRQERMRREQWRVQANVLWERERYAQEHYARWLKWTTERSQAEKEEYLRLRAEKTERDLNAWLKERGLENSHFSRENR